MRASKQSSQPAGTATLPMLVPSSTDSGHGNSRDSAAVRAFIERFTTQLCQAGFPRTPARIFVALLTSDASRMNAAELGDLLQISAASVSGGVRYLLQVGLVTAEGEPGSRRLHYRMSTAIWQDVVRLRDRQFTAWATELRQGAEVLGRSSPAGARLAETVRYFEFISREMAGLLSRWQAGAEPDRSPKRAPSVSPPGLPEAHTRCQDSKADKNGGCSRAAQSG